MNLGISSSDARELLELVKNPIFIAHAQGKEIQYRSKDPLVSNKEWLTLTRPAFNFHLVEYRVKPEPIHVFAVVRDNRSLLMVRSTRAAADAECERWNKIYGAGSYTVVELREVEK